jgi:antitoxin MazE
MKIKLITIGNSKGIRLSNTWIKQFQMKDEIELTLLKDGILLKPANEPRADWDERFLKAKTHILNKEDEVWLNQSDETGEWTW